MEEVWHLASSQPDIRDSGLKSMLIDNENSANYINLSEDDDIEEEVDQTEEIKNEAGNSDIEMRDTQNLEIQGFQQSHKKEKPEDRVLFIIKIFQVNRQKDDTLLSIVTQILLDKQLTFAEARMIVEQ